MAQARGACLALLLVASLCTRAIDQLPWEAAPGSVQVCGAWFGVPAPAEPLSREAALGRPPHAVVGHVWTWRGREAVWGVAGSPHCGDFVALELGDGFFQQYLVGRG